MGSDMAILILKLILTEPESLCCDECRVAEQGVGEAVRGMKSDNKSTNKSELSEAGTAGENSQKRFLSIFTLPNHGLLSVTDIYCTKRPLKLTWQIPKAIPSLIPVCPLCWGHRLDHRR